MSARLCKATFQVLQFLAFLFTFRVLRINLVHFLLTVAAHGTVFSLIVIPKSTDGSKEFKGIYDLSGRKVQAPKRGIYIQDGRKVLR